METFDAAFIMADTNLKYLNELKSNEEAMTAFKQEYPNLWKKLMHGGKKLKIIDMLIRINQYSKSIYERKHKYAGVYIDAANEEHAIFFVSYRYLCATHKLTIKGVNPFDKVNLATGTRYLKQLVSWGLVEHVRYDEYSPKTMLNTLKQTEKTRTPEHYYWLPDITDKHVLETAEQRVAMWGRQSMRSMNQLTATTIYGLEVGNSSYAHRYTENSEKAIATNKIKDVLLKALEQLVTEQGYCYMWQVPDRAYQINRQMKKSGDYTCENAMNLVGGFRNIWDSYNMTAIKQLNYRPPKPPKKSEMELYGLENKRWIIVPNETN